MIAAPVIDLIWFYMRMWDKSSEIGFVIVIRYFGDSDAIDKDAKYREKMGTDGKNGEKIGEDPEALRLGYGDRFSDHVPYASHLCRGGWIE